MNGFINVYIAGIPFGILDACDSSISFVHTANQSFKDDQMIVGFARMVAAKNSRPDFRG
jgi:hypothetical protein